MKPEIQSVQSEIESNFLEFQPAVEKTALQFFKSNPNLMKRYLTDYSVTHAESVVKRWRELGEYLITKYNDGYVQDEDSRPREKGYPENWLRKVLKERPEQFKVKEKKANIPESKLID